MTAKRRTDSGVATPEPPAYIVVLARVLVEAALRDLQDEPPANDNSSTLVDKEDR